MQRPNRWVTLLGGLLLTIGLAVNRYSLAWLTPDGEITHPVINAVILAFQIACAACGVYLLFKRTLGALVNLIVMAGALLATFLLGEIIVRMYFFGLDAFSIAKMNSLHHIGESGLLQPSEFQDIAFEMKPDLDVCFKRHPLCTNEYGMRDKSYPVKKPDGVYRIAVLGDSFSFPDGIALRDSYFKVLEQMLNADGLGHTFECMNFACPAYYLNQSPAVIHHRVMAFSPDLILIGFCAENDHIPPPPELFSEPFQPKPAEHPFFHSQLLKLFIWSLNPSHEHLSKEPNPDEVQYVEKNFAELERIRRNSRVPIVVAFLANIPRDSKTVDALARKHGLLFVDACSNFDFKDLSKNSIYHPLDSHPNARAHQIFAEVIHRFLLGNTFSPHALSSGADPPPR
jgi:hypothetical protein